MCVCVYYIYDLLLKQNPTDIKKITLTIYVHSNICQITEIKWFYVDFTCLVLLWTFLWKSLLWKIHS